MNVHMPVLRLYLDGEANLRPDYRLNRGSMENLMAITHSRQDHGWGHYLEVLVFHLLAGQCNIISCCVEELCHPSHNSA